MRDHRRCASWMVMLGWLLGCGWQAMPAVAAEAESDGSFLLYAPSGTEQRLLVVRARPAPRDGTGDQKTGDKNTATLELVRTLGLRFPAGRITDHPTLPLLYVSGEGRAGGPNAAVVPADKIPWGMTLAPDGRFLAVTGFESATLMLYAIDADGGLTRAATLPVDKQVSDVIAR